MILIFTISHTFSISKVIVQYIDNRNKALLDVRVEAALTKD
jgi:hypothetical protein